MKSRTLSEQKGQDVENFSRIQNKWELHADFPSDNMQ